MLAGMASGTVRRGMRDQLGIPHVLDLHVARQAVDMVIGDVRVVHEHMVVDPFEVVFAIVAHATALARHLAVAANQIAVAIGAVDALLVGQVVAELGAAAQFELLVRDLMAASAGAQAFVERAGL